MVKEEKKGERKLLRLRKKPMEELKARALIFKKRMASIKKKTMELSVLCGIDACVICLGPNGELESWPEDPTHVKPIIKLYQEHRNSCSSTSSTGGPIKKVHEFNNIALDGNNCGLIQNSTTFKGRGGRDDWVRGLSAAWLRILSRSLEKNMEAIKQRIEKLNVVKAENSMFAWNWTNSTAEIIGISSSSHMYPQSQPLPTYNLGPENEGLIAGGFEPWQPLSNIEFSETNADCYINPMISEPLCHQTNPASLMWSSEPFQPSPSIQQSNRYIDWYSPLISFSDQTSPMMPISSPEKFQPPLSAGQSDTGFDCFSPTISFSDRTSPMTSQIGSSAYHGNSMAGDEPMAPAPVISNPWTWMSSYCEDPVISGLDNFIITGTYGCVGEF